jgi:hypothetical protein
MLAQRGSVNSIDCCCVTANAVPIDPSSVIRRFHTIHSEIEWQLAFQQAPARPESSMSMKNRGDGVISFEIISCEQKKCRG